MQDPSFPGSEIAARIRMSGLTIYDDLSGSPDLRYATDVLEARLSAILVGEVLAFAIRTRSVKAKSLVATALGYDAPTTFTRIRPRFPGQDLDVYVQKRDNLQIYNEEIAPGRRFVLLRLDVNDRIVAVRVLSGAAIALLDRTGTLTGKYQARRLSARTGSFLVSATDTANFVRKMEPVETLPALSWASMTGSDRPMRGKTLTIAALYDRLKPLVGKSFTDPGHDQERL